MVTQLEYARKGTVTDIMKEVAAKENMAPAMMRELISQGKIVIIKNHQNGTAPVGVGKGLRTKVNASIGTSSDIIDEELEVQESPDRSGERCGYAHGAERGR